MNYYPFHIGDFRSGTFNMSRKARWIYRDMLDVYYDTEKPLTSDFEILCDQLGVEEEDERRVVQRLLRLKFAKEDDGYHNATCDRVIAEYQARAETAKANGKRGGRPRKQTETDEKPSGLPAGSDQDAAGNPEKSLSEANQEPITNNQEPIKEIPPTPRKRGNGFDAAMVELPHWLDAEDWQSWVADRKARKKPITEEGARRQLKQLADYRADGHQPADVIANSIAGGYQGLFPPRGQIRASPRSKAQAMADWNAELGQILNEGRSPTVIDMGVIDATGDK